MFKYDLSCPRFITRLDRIPIDRTSEKFFKMIVGIIPAKPGTADILSPELYSQFVAVIRIDFLPALEIRRFGIEDLRL